MVNSASHTNLFLPLCPPCPLSVLFFFKEDVPGSIKAINKPQLELDILNKWPTENQKKVVNHCSTITYNKKDLRITFVCVCLYVRNTSIL